MYGINDQIQAERENGQANYGGQSQASYGGGQSQATYRGSQNLPSYGNQGTLPNYQPGINATRRGEGF